MSNIPEMQYPCNTQSARGDTSSQAEEMKNLDGTIDADNWYEEDSESDDSYDSDEYKLEIEDGDDSDNNSEDASSSGNTTSTLR